MADAVRGIGESVEFSGRGLAVESTEPIGKERTEDLQEGSRLDDPRATGWVIILWMFSPSAAAGVSFVVFSVLL